MPYNVALVQVRNPTHIASNAPPPPPGIPHSAAGNPSSDRSTQSDGCTACYWTDWPAGRLIGMLVRHAIGPASAPVGDSNNFVNCFEE